MMSCMVNRSEALAGKTLDVVGELFVDPGIVTRFLLVF